MTDQIKRSSAVEKAEADIKDKMKRDSMTRKVYADVSSLMQKLHDTTEGFNRMRLELINLCGDIKGINEDAMKYVLMSRSISQGDFSSVLLDEPSEKGLTAVQDAALFAKAIEKISAERSAELRMRMCTKVRRALEQSVKDYKSKITKMGALSGQNGATDNELKIASIRVVQFNEVISVLKKRDNVVSKIYESSARALSDFIKRSSKTFHSMDCEGE